MIPKGMYCYDGSGLCHNFKSMRVGDVNVPFCNHLGQGSAGGINDQEFEKLMIFHNTNEEGIYKIYPLILLWDQVKECGENEV